MVNNDLAPPFSEEPQLAPFLFKVSWSDPVCNCSILSVYVIVDFNFQILDGWHPSEKALYPDYFARRDIRKREYIERWQKKYGNSEYESGEH